MVEGHICVAEYGMVEGHRVLSSIIIKFDKGCIINNSGFDKGYSRFLIRFEELNYFYSQMGFVFLFYF